MSKIKFPEATSEFSYNAGYHPGLSDNPPLLGTKKIPSGDPNLFKGLSFVVTGTCPSLTREDLKKLIEKHGGNVRSSISGKTSCVIRGCQEVGPKKIQEAINKKIPITDEDGLLEVIKRSNPDYKEAEDDEKPQFVINPENRPNCTLLSEKYRPTNVGEIVDAINGINGLEKFFQEHQEDGKNGCIVSGPPGTGKTSVVPIIAAKHGYKTIFFDPTDGLTTGSVKKGINQFFSNLTISNDMNIEEVCLVFDDLDGMPSIVSGLVDCINTSKVPVICIANNLDKQQLAPLTKLPFRASFSPINKDSIIKFITQVALFEGIDVDTDQIEYIADMAHGDLRFALNSLQFARKTAVKDKFIPVINNAIQDLFKPETPFTDKIEKYYFDTFLMPLYVHDMLKCENIDNYAKGMDYISIGDCISNIQQTDQNYSLSYPHAIMSCVAPTIVNPSCNFAKMPIILAKGKKRTRLQNGIITIHSHISRQMSSMSTQLITSDVANLILTEVITLVKGKHVDKAVELLGELELSLDDLSLFNDLVSFDKDIYDTLATADKTKLTSAYNKLHSSVSSSKKQTNVEERADYFIHKQAKPRAAARTSRAKAKK